MSLLITLVLIHAQAFPYQDSKLPADERADSLRISGSAATPSGLS
jgi:hypothetical protein